MIQNDVVSPTLNTNEASLGIAAVGIAFHLDPSHQPITLPKTTKFYKFSWSAQHDMCLLFHSANATPYRLLLGWYYYSSVNIY